MACGHMMSLQQHVCNGLARPLITTSLALCLQKLFSAFVQCLTCQTLCNRLQSTTDFNTLDYLNASCKEILKTMFEIL